MAEWKRVRLGEVADIQSGPFGSQLHESDYVAFNGTPIVTVEHLGAKHFTTQNLPLVSSEDKQRLSRYILSFGDVVFSRVGSVDRCSFVDRGTDGWMFSGRCIRVRTRNEVLGEFLYYYLSVPRVKQYVRDMAVGTTMPSINSSIMADVPIEFPQLATQRKIAAVLGAIDDKIETNRKICANLEAQAQAIFKSWFVDSSENVEGILQMQEAFEVTIGRTPPRKEFKWFSECRGDNVVWVSIADMGGCGTFIADSSEYLTKEAVERFGLNIVPKDTVLLSFKLTVGRVAIAATNLVTNEAIAHLRTSDSLMREYLYCYLKQFNYDTLGSTSSIATAVNSKTIREMPFAVPKREPLKKFHDVAANVFDQIREMLSESRALASMRDALLPRLMSGEIDVEKVEVV